MTVLLILATVLRFHALGFAAYDCDELYALRIQGGSLKEIASLVGRSAFHDLHPPLAYLLYMFWIDLFGTSEVAVRSLPMLLGLASVALIGFLGRRIGGVWVGLAAAAFLASNPLHIAYSQEARPYALAVTLTIAAHLFFLRSLGEPSARNQIVYAILIVAAIYTHYFSLLALLPHGLIALWLLLAGDEDSRRAARRTLLVFGCAMATFIAWMPALLFQARGESEGLLLAMDDFGQSPLGRVGFLMKETVGLGTPPILLPATIALLVLLVSAFLWRERLPTTAAESRAEGAPPRALGTFLLVAGVLCGAGLWLAAPLHLFPVARQVLLAEGYSPDAVEREMVGLQQFTVSVPLAMGVSGLLVLGWPWLSSLLDRLPRRSSGRGRPLAANAFLAFLLLVPVAVTIVLAFRFLPMLSARNLLILEPSLALALGAGAIGLAKPRWGRLALVLAVLCLALGRFQYQPVSGIFGVPGKRLGVQTGAWRDLVRELDRRGGRDLPLVMVDVPRSDPAEFYLRDRPVTRLPEEGRIAPAGLPDEFRFVHLEGNRGSARLLSSLSRVAPLERRFQVDEYVIYDARGRFR
ncbi:MAG TPA: glycosyltransferase family 39 protein [Thermoanaerobaculia bacterium]